MAGTIEKLKKKWNIARTIDIVLILAVFSLAGSTESMALRPFVKHFIKSINEWPLAGRIFFYAAIFIPIYQCLLLFYGLLLGQFKFFWEREKQIIRFLGRGFRRNKPAVQ